MVSQSGMNGLLHSLLFLQIFHLKLYFSVCTLSLNLHYNIFHPFPGLLINLKCHICTKISRLSWFTNCPNMPWVAGDTLSKLLTELFPPKITWLLFTFLPQISYFYKYPTFPAAHNDVTTLKSANGSRSAAGWPNVKSESNCFKPYTYYLLPLPRLSVEFFFLFLRISFLFNPQSKKHVSLLESSFQEFSTFSTFQKSVSLFWGFAAAYVCLGKIMCVMTLTWSLVSPWCEFPNRQRAASLFGNLLGKIQCVCFPYKHQSGRIQITTLTLRMCQHPQLIM